MKIFLVQSSGDLNGSSGYAAGLLEAGHPHLLVSFVDYMGNPARTDIFYALQRDPKKSKRITAPRAPTLNSRISKKAQALKAGQRRPARGSIT